MKYKYVFSAENIILENKWIQYLEEMSLKGWKLKSMSYFFLKFEKCNHPYKFQIDYNPLNDEYLSLLHDLGYEYIGDRGYQTHIYCNANLHATDLHTDEQTHQEIINKNYNLYNIIIKILLAIIFLINFFKDLYIPHSLAEFYINFHIYLIKFAYLCISIGFIIDGLSMIIAKKSLLYQSKTLISIYKIMKIVSHVTQIISIFILALTSFYNFSIFFQLILIIIIFILIKIITTYFQKNTIFLNFHKSIESIIELTILIYAIIGLFPILLNDYKSDTPSFYSYHFNESKTIHNLFVTNNEHYSYNNNFYEMSYTCLTTAIADEIYQDNLIKMVQNNQKNDLVYLLYNYQYKEFHEKTTPLSYLESILKCKKYENDLIDECYYFNHQVIIKKDNIVVRGYINQIQDIDGLIQFYF